MNHTNAATGQANQHLSFWPGWSEAKSGTFVLSARIPDYASFHSGYKILRCPSGKTRERWVNAAR
jgi:hypothetical protein